MTPAARRGANLFTESFSSFASSFSTAFGTDVLGVNLSSGLSLAAGNYLVFIYNTSFLGTPGYGGGAGSGIFQYGQFSGPTSGVGYTVNGDDAGVSLNSEAIAGVPEPSAWALMIGGFGLAGAALRRRRAAVAA